jgi:hypothetical protein
MDCLPQRRQRSVVLQHDPLVETLQQALSRHRGSNALGSRGGWSCLDGLLYAEKPESKFCENVSCVFNCARFEADPLGHYPQIGTQHLVTLLNMVSNFAALERRNRRVGNAPPSYVLPVLQLIYFATQSVKLRHAIHPLYKRSWFKL